MYRIRLESSKSINYDIFDEKELVVGSIVFNNMRRRWVVQLEGEIKSFPSLSSAVRYVIPS